MTQAISRLGSLIINFTVESGRVLILLKSTILQSFVLPLEVKNTFKQMYIVGVNSTPVVLITGLFTGMVLALQTFTGFERFGAESLVGSVVALSMTREMGPVLTGMIVTGRAGSAMAAELGTMRVTEQIDALEVLATNPVKYLIVPRFIAGLVMLPALTVISDIIGIFGGYTVTTGVFGASPTQYWRMCWDYTDVSDIYNGLIKACFFGGAMSLLCCYRGYYTTGGAEGVGKSTTGAVVLTFMAILISDYFLSAWLFR